MMSSLVTIKKMMYKIKKVSIPHAIVLVIFFWTLLLVQIKGNSKTRKNLFKILYITSGVLSILGVVGTTTMLGYKMIYP